MRTLIYIQQSLRPSEILQVQRILSHTRSQAHAQHPRELGESANGQRRRHTLRSKARKRDAD
jgi:hypothetical protein